MKMLTLKKINKVIQHLNIELVRGRGYFYILDSNGNQVGDSICVFRLNHMSIERWLETIDSEVNKMRRHFL
jgi:hypothetical protein